MSIHFMEVPSHLHSVRTPQVAWSAALQSSLHAVAVASHLQAAETVHTASFCFVQSSRHFINVPSHLHSELASHEGCTVSEPHVSTQVVFAATHLHKVDAVHATSFLEAQALTHVIPVPSHLHSASLPQVG